MAYAFSLSFFAFLAQYQTIWIIRQRDKTRLSHKKMFMNYQEVLMMLHLILLPFFKMPTMTRYVL